MRKTAAGLNREAVLSRHIGKVVERHGRILAMEARPQHHAGEESGEDPHPSEQFMARHRVTSGLKAPNAPTNGSGP